MADIGDSGTLLEGILDLPQLCDELQRTPRTIHRWMDAPDGLPHGYLGGRLIFDRQKVRAWIDAQIRVHNPTIKRNRVAKDALVNG